MRNNLRFIIVLLVLTALLLTAFAQPQVQPNTNPSPVRTSRITAALVDRILEAGFVFVVEGEEVGRLPICHPRPGQV